MAITLAQAKVGMADKVDQNVIDEFRRSSLLLDSLIFDDSISPGTGGSTLTYGYTKILTPSTAGVRQINTEYTSGEAIREKATADAVIMGGKIELDRVIIGTAGAVDELAFQIKQKVIATSNEFSNLTINGDSANNEFDGLDKLLTGSATEVISTTDVSTSALMDSNYNSLLDEVDAFLSLLDGEPTLLLMNNKMLTKMRNAARRAGFYERTRDEFGRQVESYNKIPMEDVGKYFDGTNSVDIIPVTTGKTDIYAVTIATDGFHGISVDGSKIIKSYLPDLNLPGAVKDGDVELIGGVVLKNTNKAGVLRDITVSA